MNREHFTPKYQSYRASNALLARPDLGNLNGKYMAFIPAE
jgi:hypothetical protein